MICHCTDNYILVIDIKLFISTKLPTKFASFHNYHPSSTCYLYAIFDFHQNRRKIQRVRKKSCHDFYETCTKSCILVDQLVPEPLRFETLNKMSELYTTCTLTMDLSDALCSSTSQMSACPFQAARWSGVQPLLSTSVTEALAASSAKTTSLKHKSSSPILQFNKRRWGNVWHPPSKINCFEDD